MGFLYNLFINFYLLLINVASVFNIKAKKWIIGRRHIFERFASKISIEDEYIWVHCASLGEFEQGHPIIKSIKKQFPKYKILLTFFSPSGYEIRKDYEFADVVEYLPSDTKMNAKRMLEIIKPKIAIFVKYEFWFNYLKELHYHNIPVFFISSIFRPNQYFFKFYGAWFRNRLKTITHFFVQNEQSKELLIKINIENVTSCGDTRFDQVYMLSQNPLKFPLVESFKGKSKLIIVGSSWPQDEEIVFPLIDQFPDTKFIIAPHEVHPARINKIVKKLDNQTIVYSKANAESINRSQVLIIDSIGILAQLYQYATLVYIGGGFGVGIHNIQEPITYGKPVIFGPRFEKFQEAKDLIKQKGVFSIKTKEQLNKAISLLINDQNEYQHSVQICKDYVEENIGASKIILNQLKEYLT
ncbi:MAG: 3-deoxy-D-manno-octulosonic acid transferase [Bacteroidetes bacterium]|nr:3-deoxy-D-manno-octulosonic acid transferase [Bacteroidota bacterium]